MSDVTPTPAPPASPAPTVPITTPPATQTATSTGFFAAIMRGAETVYHEAVAAEQCVSKWVEGHPAVGPLITKAIVFAESVLAADGLVAPATINAVQAMIGALGSMAQGDASVQSGAQGAPPSA